MDIQHSPVASSKHVLFELEDEHYAVPLLEVREVLSDYELTALPHLPAVVHGVTSVRGEPIPVMSLRHRVGMEPRARDRRTRVLVLEVDTLVVGLEVDAVLRVDRLALERMVAPPRMAGVRAAPYLKGVIPDGAKFVVVLDTAGLIEGLGQAAAMVGATADAAPAREAAGAAARRSS